MTKIATRKAADLHISDRVREALVQLGFTSADGASYSRKVEGAAEAGTVSDGTRMVTLRIDAITGRWLELVNGWGTVESDLDLRDYSDPLLAIWALCPALKPATVRLYTITLDATGEVIATIDQRQDGALDVSHDGETVVARDVTLALGWLGATGDTRPCTINAGR